MSVSKDPESRKKQPEKPLPEILNEVKLRSKSIGEAATEISKRIEQFEKWLGTLPGRVETVLWVNDPDSEPNFPTEFGLMLHRVGKEWILSVGYDYHSGDPFKTVEWKPLRDASVDEKIFSVSLFPQFIKKLGNSQLKLISRLEEANAQFDELASAIGIEKKEGA